MTREDILKAIAELPKIETNNPISAMNSISVDDLMNAIDRLNKVPDYNDLLKENQELNKKYVNAVSDYETTKTEKEQLNSLVNSCQEEIRQLKKQLEEHKNKYIKRFEKLLAEDVEPDPENLYMAELEQRAMDCEAMEIQQKEFIKYLEDEIERLPGLTTLFYRNAKNKLIGHTEIVQGAYKEILQKYKEIVNGTEQN